MRQKATKSILYKSLVLLILSACADPRTYSAQEIAEICNERKEETAGPQGQVSVGINSRDGLGLGASISVNDKFLRGLDPDAVYEQCVQKLQEHNLRVERNGLA